VNIEELLREASDGLRAAGVPQPAREAGLLLSLALKRDRSFLIAHPEYTLSEGELERFRSFVARRTAREPYQYISGKQEFFGSDFMVSPAVLIPRPETELLVETAIAELGRSGGTARFCELGVGSGCISISILRHVPNAAAWAGDISVDAVEIARRNAVALGVDDRIRLNISDLFEAAGEQTFELIVSNPPYVPAAEISGLQPEVRDHEPYVALSDAADGLSIISKIIDEAPAFLNAGGVLLLEIGFDQSAKVLQMYPRSIWETVELLPDLQGIPRVVKAVLRGN
jgi:release factor glutamine methyltransferase